MTVARGTGPYALWVEAGGGTPAYSRERYLALLREHGHLLSPGEDGYDDAGPDLECGYRYRRLGPVKVRRDEKGRDYA